MNVICTVKYLFSVPRANIMIPRTKKRFCDNNNFKLDQFRTITAPVIISMAAIKLVNGFPNVPVGAVSPFIGEFVKIFPLEGRTVIANFTFGFHTPSALFDWTIYIENDDRLIRFYVSVFRWLSSDIRFV